MKISIAVIGPGSVGKVFLSQVHHEMASLYAKYGIELNIFGIANSRKMITSVTGSIDVSLWEEQLAQQGQVASLSALIDGLASFPTEHRAVIDCTASEKVATMYPEWLKRGIHVCTPNKKLNSGPIANFSLVKQIQREHRVFYFYEGTVGAGLPILSTLKTLLDTGDKIERIEGIFSGTLSFIFNQLRPGVALSEVVRLAAEQGYTEPDPRDDLSGTDVARKVLILARECGEVMELSDVAIESLVPAALNDTTLSVADFLSQLPTYDGNMTHKVQEADAAGKVVRYVGSYDAQKRTCSAGLSLYPASHPFAQLSGTENSVAFYTTRYSDPPLMVRGPGAGTQVTAAGVFGDLITLCRYLGASS